MADDKNIKKDKLPEPTFIEQANALIDKKFEEAKLIEDPNFGPGLRPFDHKVLVSVIDLQVTHVNDILVEKYTAKIAEFYEPIMDGISSIQKDQVVIKKDISKINRRLAKAEKMAKSALDKVTIEEKKIDDLREDYEKNKHHLEYVARIRPTLESIQKVFIFWTWKENWLKIIGSIITGIVIVFALFWIFLSIMKIKGVVTEDINLKPRSYDQKMTREDELRILGASTRAIKTNISQYSEDQQDSIHDEIIRQKEIVYEKRNREYNEQCKNSSK